MSREGTVMRWAGVGLSLMAGELAVQGVAEGLAGESFKRAGWVWFCKRLTLMRALHVQPLESNAAPYLGKCSKESCIGTRVFHACHTVQMC